jgi:ElaB/YqjD/DUF883 family membrane-anchored ribosome-binding protein
MDTNKVADWVPESVVNDLKLVIRDAEDLLRSTGAQMDERYQAARARFESTLSNARSGLSTLEERVTSTSREAIENADEYVQDHPWQSVGIGALAGLAIGLWLGRR